MTEHEHESCGGGGCGQALAEAREPRARMDLVEHKLMVLSGKGGVGKSTVAVNLAVSLAMAGKRVGLLDVDIHGPSVPKLLKLDGATVQGTETALFPVEVPLAAGTLRVMSIGLLLRERDDAVIWRGPRKYGVIKQFLEEVEWGALDYLVVDAPPGTGDEPLAIAELLKGADGAVIVTTPQELAVQDVRRCIAFCRQLSLPVLGVVENMSGFVCPGCGERFDIFGADGGRRMAEEMAVPYLGAIPIEPGVVSAGDAGTPVVLAEQETETSRAFGRIVRRLLAHELAAAARLDPLAGSEGDLVVAVPVSGGLLCQHFGHCDQFALFTVARPDKTIRETRIVGAPPHEPGLLPGWLRAKGAGVVIAGGMGARAQSLFSQQGIAVVVGAPSVPPDRVVEDYLAGTLRTGENVCDH